VKLLREDGSEATTQHVVAWLASRGGGEYQDRELVLEADVPEERKLPWQQHGASEQRAILLEHYVSTTTVGSDRVNVPAALEKIGSSRVLTPEERSGYPY
jgi:hypothetical protein